MRKKPCLQSTDVHKMAAACRAEAEKNKWVVTIAITDDAGVLLYLDRMEGAGPTSAEMTSATEKAANTVGVEMPKSRAIGAASMAGR